MMYAFRSYSNIRVLCFLLLFYGTLGKIYFKEEFIDGEEWQKRWVHSEHPSRKWGKFILSHGSSQTFSNIGTGIKTSQDRKHYAISTKFEPFTNKGKTFVLQYSIKHEGNVTCGGRYIKLFNCSFDPYYMHDQTPYILMFGPDTCIPTVHEVHVIFNYRGKNLPVKKNILWPEDSYIHLYTLIINPDNTYVVKIDNTEVKVGELENDWNFLHPRKIEDFKARKPKTWDDNPDIDDPLDKKPDDWADREYIRDPNATKPEDWDDDVDDKWEPPFIKNPAYKGIWKPRKIPNPKYKGKWKRPVIDNPLFLEDVNLHAFAEICGVGIDIWQVESGTIFDNILITDDADEADAHGWKTWGVLKEEEKKLRDKAQEIERKHVHDEL